jgi:glycosyltransferase involved in cell wall biosynthesis
MNAPATVSVLMPVHAGAVPDHVAEALDSVWAQTRAPDQVVVVADGELTAAHESLLGRPGLEVVRLSRARGAGGALEAGLAACRGQYVARADSDDVNEPHRLASQLEDLEASGADVCSAAMTEFSTRPPRVVGIRTSPTTHDDFARLMKTRNPVNHPAVMFRRAAAVSAGGYRELPFLEDYDLWARMLAAGCRFVGSNAPLVRFRVDGMHVRRTSREVGRSERLLQARLVEYGVIGRPRAVFNLALRGTYRALPLPVTERVYALLFRRTGTST